MRPEASIERASCPMSQIQNLFQENLLRTIKNFNDKSYLYRDTVTLVHQSKDYWSSRFVASFPSRVPLVPC